MNKTTLSMIAFCLGGASAAHAAGSNVDLQNLEVLNESRVETKTFHHLVNPNGDGNYSNMEISDGNYSNMEISDANYSNMEISDGNYSNMEISDANYSNMEISDGGSTVHAEKIFPAPKSAE